MRCKNCGWENPANNAKCEKCNASLSGLMEPEENVSSRRLAPMKTAKGCPECGYPIRDVEKSCPHCEYVFVVEKQETPAVEEPLLRKEPPPTPELRKETPPAPKQTPAIPKPAQKTCTFCKVLVAENAHYCSNCGAPLMSERKTLDSTIKPWLRAEQIQAPGCSLTLISGDDEPANASVLRFSGNVIQLNRSNTEPSNQTITSKTQAELSFEDDKWYIQDKSALKTTYVYVGSKVEIKQDDIIVMGNRSFKFGYESVKQPE
ncbi:MAG: zinc ribbon domain-containing protein [Tannerella sp.]|jgi:uncharacterized Zn finger protein (UPF0148 family)|nr:zinc ribbon domain-containing protein [Tannerella sp.]